MSHYTYLLSIYFHNLQNKNAPPAVILFSIIALEKFAQTTENKITIQKRLQEVSNILYNEQESPKSSFIDGENNKLTSIYALEKGINSYWFRSYLIPITS